MASPKTSAVHSPHDELACLIDDYICIPGMQLRMDQLQSLLQSVDKKETLEVLKKRSGTYLFTAFHTAAMRNHSETIACFLQAIAPELRYDALEVRDCTGQTPLHRAAVAGKRSSIKQLISGLPSPELQLDYIYLRDDGDKCARGRAIHSKFAETSALLLTLTDDILRRIASKKNLPEERANRTTENGVWKLELIIQQQERKYLQIKAGYDQSLLENENLSLEAIQEKTAELQEVKNNLENARVEVVNRTMEVKGGAKVLKKDEVPGRLEQISIRLQKLCKEMDVFTRQLNMVSLLRRQIEDMFSNLQHKDQKLKVQEDQLAALKEGQKLANDIAASTANEMRQHRAADCERFSGAEERIDYIEKRVVPTVGGSEDQPKDAEDAFVLQVSTNPQMQQG